MTKYGTYAKLTAIPRNICLTQNTESKITAYFIRNIQYSFIFEILIKDSLINLLKQRQRLFTTTNVTTNVKLFSLNDELTLKFWLYFDSIEATKTKKFFNREEAPYPIWVLKGQDDMLAEYNIKSKEARKYIFNCLDDMSRVNMPKYEASELVVEKVSIIEFLLPAEF